MPQAKPRQAYACRGFKHIGKNLIMDVVIDASTDAKLREQVKEIYGNAALKPAGLCCPKSMPRTYIEHIPADAFEHSYGCGSPILGADVRPGERVVDLGCGIGIDCFTAAKLVGPEGRVIGVDMTNEMLSKAYSFNGEVSRNLGYDVVSFRKGTVDQIPLEDGSVDLLVSNCVVNLATDKAKVFKEIHRVLRQGGRAVISDVVSDREIRVEDRSDPSEWADCTVSSMSLRGFLNAFSDAGFVALRQISEEPWRQIKGYHLSSITLEARKFETDCHAGVGHLAIYLGPFAEVKDDFGNSYSRFKPAAIRDDVASFLRKSGEASPFIVVAGRAAAKKPAVAPAPAAGRLASPCCDPTDKAMPCCDDNAPKTDGSPCCDTLSTQQPASCGCSPAAEAAPTAKAKAASPGPAAASSCCEGGAGGCGPGAATAPPATTPVAATGESAAAECCPCETDAKVTGGDCCGDGCGTCGCE